MSEEKKVDKNLTTENAEKKPKSGKRSKSTPADTLTAYVRALSENVVDSGGERFSRCPLANTAFRAGHDVVIVRDSDKVAWYGYDKLNPVGYTKHDFLADDGRQHTVYSKIDLKLVGAEIKGYKRK